LAVVQELIDIIKHVKPHVLIGLTGAGPAFDESVVKALCEHCEHPLIFPLSNPTEKAEITAENAFKWSGGKCLFGSGVRVEGTMLNVHAVSEWGGQGNEEVGRGGGVPFGGTI